MTRRRPRIVFKAELPIRAGAVDALLALCDEPARLLEPSSNEGRAEYRLEIAKIVRDYRDGRRLQAQMASAPDVRFTLTALANEAAKLKALLENETLEHRLKLGHVAQWRLLKIRGACLGEGLASILNDFAAAAVTLEGEPRWRGVASSLAQKVSNLPMKAEWELIVLQQYAPFPPRERGVELSEIAAHVCARLCDLASVASDILKSERGPRSDTTQMRAVLRLKSLFEQKRGDATHSAKIGRTYEGVLASPFGKFVESAMKCADPEDRHGYGLADAISFACWPSRGRRKDRAADARCKSRDDQIVACLKSRGVTIFSSPD